MMRSQIFLVSEQRLALSFNFSLCCQSYTTSLKQRDNDLEWRGKVKNYQASKIISTICYLPESFDCIRFR